ncbi:MAG: serine/threonine protein kinase [Aestuariibacter sp.]|nr:serine/threonine protein kinase [Aestuariibacter sp.]
MKLSPHFDSSEFLCKCGCGRGEPPLYLVDALEWLRAILGNHPIKITSGYRCTKHNKAVGGVRKSTHVGYYWNPFAGHSGNGGYERHTDYTFAADIQVRGVPNRVVQAAAKEIFDGVGSYKSFTHCDVRGKKARWNG